MNNLDNNNIELDRTYWKKEILKSFLFKFYLLYNKLFNSLS